MNIDDIITGLYPLPEHAKILLKSQFKEITYPKGHILLKEDCVEEHIYFIKRGVVRAYSNAINGQVTFWFGLEGAPVLSMHSYIFGKKSYERIELLEDCDLYKINILELRSLYEKDVHLANWGRKLAEQELVKTEERLIAMQFKTAQERYMDLMNDQPALLLRVQLGYIASYLGMSQVSLSRIRADKKK
ncbi:CRP-like cAMP-binding protein [Pedobacter sp. CAN_A7]|uniref:Crp/Fnr family transcriptional regulator n=1 Tax=Pedobacter sp. CAN_A7 TaxID=2787722 RepID=UPI0018CBA6CB